MDAGDLQRHKEGKKRIKIKKEVKISRVTHQLCCWMCLMIVDPNVQFSNYKQPTKLFLPPVLFSPFLFSCLVQVFFFFFALARWAQLAVIMCENLQTRQSKAVFK